MAGPMARATPSRHYTGMSESAEKEFTTLEGVAFCAAMIGVQLSSELFAQWGTYFYSPSVGSGRATGKEDAAPGTEDPVELPDAP